MDLLGILFSKFRIMIALFDTLIYFDWLCGLLFALCLSTSNLSPRISFLFVLVMRKSCLLGGFLALVEVFVLNVTDQGASSHD